MPPVSVYDCREMFASNGELCRVSWVTSREKGSTVSLNVRRSTSLDKSSVKDRSSGGTVSVVSSSTGMGSDRFAKMISLLARSFTKLCGNERKVLLTNVARSLTLLM